MLYQEPEPTLSDEQDEGLHRILNTDGHAFIGGSAGTGKSTLIRAIRQRLPCILAATTGSAAMNIGGMTVDSLFSLNRDNWEVRNPDKLAKNMARCARNIIIDEGGSAGLKMSDYLLRVAKMFKKRILLFGDLAQAAPVKDGLLVYSELFLQAQQIRLTQVHRQSDPTFLTALQDIRKGELSQATINLFRGQVGASPEDDSWVRIYATNALANGYNRQRLSAIDAPETTPMASHVDLRPYDQQDKMALFDGVVEERLANSRLAHGTPFRKGARVILTRNVYDGDPMEVGPEAVRFVNGDTGTIEEILTPAGIPVEEAPPLDLMSAFEPGNEATEWVPPYHDPTEAPPVAPGQPKTFLVRLDRTGEVVMVERVGQEIQDPLWSPNKPVGVVWGFPIKLGWSGTIHSVQGQTLEKAYVDMGSICQHPLVSRHGLAYVALSRVRTLQGLRISGWYPEAIYVDPAVRPYI